MAAGHALVMCVALGGGLFYPRKLTEKLLRPARTLQTCPPSLSRLLQHETTLIKNQPFRRTHARMISTTQTSWKGDHFPHRRSRLFSGAGARPKPGTCQVRSEQPAGGQASESLLEARSSVASGSLPPSHSYFCVLRTLNVWVTTGKLNHTALGKLNL